MERVIETQKVVETVPPVIVTESPTKAYKKKKAIFRTYQVIWYIVGIIEVLLVFRIALKAFGANPYSGFTDLIYTITNPLAMPFSGIFGTTVTQGSVFEWSTIIAGIVYFLLGLGLEQLLQLIKPTNPIEVEETVDNT